jgi:hypothetical protein
MLAGWVSGPSPKSATKKLIGGQPVAITRSSNPQRARAAIAGPRRKWARMVSLGKVALSTSSNLAPWRASSIAVGEPAQRAPTTIAS